MNTASRPAHETRPAAADTQPAHALEAFDDWAEHLRDALTTSRPAATDARGLAAAYLADRRFEAALRGFDRLLTRAPDDPALLSGKASALAGLSRHEDALPLLERVIERQPDDLAARFNYGVALMRTGQLAEAAVAFDGILRRQPTHAAARFNLAVVQQARGQSADALRIWREVTGAKGLPGLPPAQRGDAWFHRGELAMGLHAAHEAVECFERVVAAEPADVGAWCNLGIARAVDGQRSAAVAALEQALRLSPRCLPALNQLAMVHAAILRDTNDAASRDRALDLCRRSLAVDPAQPNIRQLRNALLGGTSPERDNAPAE